MEAAVTWRAMVRDSPEQTAALPKASMGVSASIAVSSAKAGVAVAAHRQFRRLLIHLH